MKKKSSLKNKFLTLAVLATVLGGSAFMPKASAAMNWTLATPTGSTYKTSITTTGVHQVTKDGDITLGNQINFGTYQQSLKTGSFSAPLPSSNHDAFYSATDATFNVDPVKWIVVEKDTGGTAGIYTLVSTKVLDGGVAWNPNATTYTGTNGEADSQNWEKMTGENTLRYYMNNTMYTSLTEGMSAAQKGLIQDSEITTYKASGETGKNGWDSSTTVLCISTDKLYLMSVQELHEWFKNTPDTNPQYDSGNPYPGGDSASGKVPWGAGATDYAKSTGISIQTDGGVTAVDGTFNADYFLRSPTSSNVNYVRLSISCGAVYNTNATRTYFGSRPALQINLSSLIFTSKSSYDYHYGTADESKFTAGKGSAAVGGDAVKLETIGSSDTLDLTLYDSGLGTVTTATTLELSNDDIKLGYSGSGTDKSVAGMLATGDSTAYTPVAWGRLSSGSVSGTGILGLGNVDAGTEYSLLIFNEQGTGTSFIGDANVFDGLKKNSSSKTELDLTTTKNASKTFNGVIKVGEGNKLTAKASQLTGGSTVTSTNDGTIILKDTGTVAMNITNSGTVEFAAGAGNTITVSGKVTGGTVNVTSGMMKYTNPSTTDKIGSVLNISSGAALDPDAGTLAESTTNNGDLYLSGGTLSVDIEGTGTTYLKENPEATSGSTVTVNSDRNISGTLNGSSGTIKMTGDNALTTLTIGTLTGTTNLEIDVDMSSFTADKLAVGTITGATVNVSGINITKDIVLTDNTLTLPVDGSNEITYVTNSTGGTAGDATYQVGGAADGTVVVTNNYKYIFSKGTENGTLKYRAEAGDLTFKKFVEGTLIDPSTGSQYTSDPATLSLTADIANTGTDSDAITMGGHQSNDAITVNLNGHNLTSTLESTVTVNNGKTFNLNGGSEAVGTVDDKTGFSVLNGGSLAVSGKIIINGDITNAGTVTFAGTTTVAGTLDGAGAYSNSGNLTVTDAYKLQMTGTGGLKNTGTLNLGSVTETELGTDITDAAIPMGTINIDGIITTAKAITQKSMTIAAAGSLTMTESGKSLIISNAIVNQGKLKIRAPELKSDVTNSGTVELTTGTLAMGYTITGGKIDVTGTVDANVNDLMSTQGITVVKEVYGLANGTLHITGEGALNDSISGEGMAIIGTDSERMKNITSDKNISVKEFQNYGNFTNGTGIISSGTVINWESFTTPANLITGTELRNRGKLYLTGGDLGTTITSPPAASNSITYIRGEVTNTTGKTIIQKKLEIEAAGTLTTEVDALIIDGDAGTITNAGTLTLTADGTAQDTLQEAVAVTTGTLNFNGEKKIIADGTITQATVNVNTDVDMNNTLTAAVNVASGKTLTIDADYLVGDVSNSGTVALKEGILADGRTITGGDVKLGSGVEFKKNNIAETAIIEADGAKYSFTATITDTVTLDAFAASTKATGTLAFGSISVDSTGDTLAIGESKEVAYLTGNALNAADTTITFGDATSTVISDGHKYKFAQAKNGSSDKHGYFAVTKDYAYNLAQIINNNHANSDPFEPGTVDTYVLASDLTLTDSVQVTAGSAGMVETNHYGLFEGGTNNIDASAQKLGILTPASGLTVREFTINGNNHKLLAKGTGETGEYNGVRVGSGSSLTINDVSEINGFSSYFVNNIDGTVNISNTGTNTTTLNSKLTGSGTYTNSGNLIVADASNLAMTGTEGLKNTGTLTLGNATSSELDVDITDDATTVGTININGVITTAKAITQKNMTIAAAGSLTMTESGKILKVTNAIDNKGTLTIGASDLQSDVTNGTALSEVVLRGGTLADSNTITGGIVKITENVSTIGTNLLNGNGNNMNVRIVTDKTLTITGGELAVAVGDSANNTGMVKFTGETTADKEIYTAVEVGADDGVLKVAADLLKNASNTNYGILTLTGDNKTLENSISGDGGKTYVDGSVTLAEGESITQSTLIINNGKSLTAEVDALTIGGGSGSITNEGTLTLTGDGTTDTMYESVNGAGTLNFEGNNKITAFGGITQTTVNVKTDVDMNAALTAAIRVDAGKTLSIGAGNLMGEVTNSGTVALSAGTLEDGSTITGGSVNITGDVEANANDIAGDTNTIATDKTLTLNGGTINKAFTNNGTVKLDGASLGGAYVTAGTMEFAANLTTSGDNVAAATNKVDGGVTLTLNTGTLNKEITNSGAVEMGTGSAFGANGKISGGSVTLGSDVHFRNANISNTVTGLKLNGAIYDFNANVGSTTGVDQITIAGAVTDTVKLGSVNITGEDETWEIGTSRQVDYISGGSGHTVIINNSITNTSDCYKYTFGQYENVPGKMNILKEEGFTLNEIVTGRKGDSTDPAEVDTFAMTEDTTLNDPALNHYKNDGTEQGNLGTLAEDRTLTIGGNGYDLLGGSTAASPKNGIEVAEGSTLNLDNLGTISGFDEYAVKNDGTLNIKGGTSGDPAQQTITVLESGITGTGETTLGNDAIVDATDENAKIEQDKLTIGSGSKLILDADNLDLGAGGLVNNGTLELAEGTLNEKVTGNGANITTGPIALGTEGEIIFDPDNVGGDITNNGKITLKGNGQDEDSGTYPDSTDQLQYKIGGNGTITIDPTGQMVTSDAGNLASAGGITNTGDKLTLTGGTLGVNLGDGNGTVTIDGDVEVADGKQVANKVKINAQDGTEPEEGLTIKAGDLKGNVTIEGEGDDAGILTLKGTSELDENVTINGGTVKIGKTDGTAETSTIGAKSIEGVDKIEITKADGSTTPATEADKLVIKAGATDTNIDAPITGGDLQLTGTGSTTTLGGKVDVENLDVDGKMLAKDVITADNFTVGTNGNLTIDVDCVGSDIVNNGSITLTANGEDEDDPIDKNHIDQIRHKIGGNGTITIDPTGQMVTSDAGNLASAGGITNTGDKLTLTGGTLGVKLGDGNGTVTIDGDVEVADGKQVANKVRINAQDGTEPEEGLTIRAGDLKGNVTIEGEGENAGILTLKGTSELDENVTINGGTVKIGKTDGTAETSTIGAKSIEGVDKIEITKADGSTTPATEADKLVIKAGATDTNIDAPITGGDLQLTGTGSTITLTGPVDVEDLNMDGKVVAKDVITADNFTVGTNGNLTIDVDCVGSDIINNGTITLTANGEDEDDLVNKTHIDQLRHKIGGNGIITIDPAGQMVTSDAGNLASAGGITNTGDKLTLTGGTLGVKLGDGNGTVTIDGDVEVADGKQVANKVRIKSQDGTEPEEGLTIRAGDLKGNVTIEGEGDDAGILTLKGTSELDENVTINGGTLKIGKTDGTAETSTIGAKSIEGVDKIEITKADGSTTPATEADKLVIKAGATDTNIDAPITGGDLQLTDTGSTTTLGGKVDVENLDVDGKMLAKDVITADNFTVGTNGNLTIDVDCVGSDIINKGTISLTTNGQDEDDPVGRTHIDQLRYKIDGGNVIVAEDLTDDGTHLADSSDPKTGTLTVKEGKTLTITGTGIGRDVTGDTGTTYFSNVTSEIGITSTINNGLKFADGAKVRLTEGGNVRFDSPQNLSSFAMDDGSVLTVKLAVLEGDDGCIVSNLTAVPQIAPGAKLNITDAEGIVENGIYTLARGDAGVITGNETLWDLGNITLDPESLLEFVYVGSADSGMTATPGVISLKAISAMKFTEEMGYNASKVLTEMSKSQDGTIKNFMKDIAKSYKRDVQNGLDAAGSITNLHGVAGVSNNITSTVNVAFDNALEHMSVIERPMTSHGVEKMKIQDTAAEIPGAEMTPDYVELGEVSDIMPEREAKGVYAKEVWASYVHNKENIDGLDLGSVKNTSTGNYNGATVGADLWSSSKGFGGVALMYVDGTINGSNSAASTRNEVKNYGIAVYNRNDMGKGCLNSTISFVHAKNDISQNNLGHDIKAEPKVNAISIGTQYELPLTTGRSALTAFGGVRYSFIKTNGYSNTIDGHDGAHYEVDNQNIFNVPVGLKWKGSYASGSWSVKPYGEIGYNWNFGGRNNNQTVSYNGVSEDISFDINDPGSYYAKVGLEFVRNNLTFGVQYKYLKGKAVKNRKLNVNMSLAF